MTKLSKDAAYLIKNGMPYDTVIGMSPAELKENVRTMQAAERPPRRGIGCLGVILLFVVGAAILGSLAPSSEHPAALTAATNGTAPPKQVIKISAGELFSAYDDNEVATDERLSGKLIDVTGRVQSIDKNVWGSMYVGLRTSNEFMPAHMNVDDSQKDKVASLRKGQLVIFRCSKMKRWVGSPMGDGCVLMDSQ